MVARHLRLFDASVPEEQHNQQQEGRPEDQVYFVVVAVQAVHDCTVIKRND